MNNEFYGSTVYDETYEALYHAGKPGMKWGYTNGQKNGNRVAEYFRSASEHLMDRDASGRTTADAKHYRALREGATLVGRARAYGELRNGARYVPNDVANVVAKQRGGEYGTRILRDHYKKRNRAALAAANVANALEFRDNWRMGAQMIKDSLKRKKKR